MAVNPVSLSDSLRPWLDAGVYCLLLGEELPGADDFLIEPTPVVSSPLAPAEPKKPEIAPVPHTALKEVATNPQPQRADTGNPSLTVRNIAESSPAMPAEWQALMDKTPSAPVLWTYPELGLDLVGKGSKERSLLFRGLIGSLQLPKGSSAFWPLTMQSRNEFSEDILALEKVFFSQGIEKIRPKVLILFGFDSVELSPLPVSNKLFFTQELCQGRLLLLLPGVDDLLLHPELQNKAVVYLRAALSGLPALFLGGPA